MAKRDYYEILEVTRTATDAEMKASYRKLAMKWHPDRNPGDKDCEAHFKEINEAYDVLKDEQKRAAYDRFGHAAFEQGGPGGAHGFGADFASSFSDIFEDLFGMGGRRGGGRGGRERGADLRYNMEITLEEAFSGKTAQVRIPTSVTCEACSGAGAKAGSKPKTCPTCGGAGQSAPYARLLHAGAHLRRLPGPRPGHRQSMPELHRLRPRHARAHALGQCAGRRRGRHPHPPCRRGRGGSARRAGRATSTSSCRSSPHPFFQRDGADLHCRVPISMVTAALGGEFDVPTIDGGKTRVKVPEGTQSGRRFRLGGKGMPVLRARETGDMYVQVLVETPQKLTKRQKELLQEFEQQSSTETQPEAAGFFSKVKEFLDGLGNRQGSA